MLGTPACQAIDHTALDRGGARAGLQGEARGWWGGLIAGVEGHIPQCIGPCCHLYPLAPQDLEAEAGARNWTLPPMPMLALWTQDQASTCPAPHSHWSPSHRCGVDQSPRLQGCQDGRRSDQGAGLDTLLLASVPLASNLARVQVPQNPVGGPAGLLSSQHWPSQPAAAGSQLHCPAQPQKLCDCSSQDWLLQTVTNKHVPN